MWLTLDGLIITIQAGFYVSEAYLINIEWMDPE